MKRDRPSSNSPLYTFADRLNYAIGSEAVYAFAKRAGISDTSLRSYLKGAVPGVDKALQMAQTAEVNLKWLISGEGTMELSSADTHENDTEFVYIPFVDVSASAGTGLLVQEENVEDVVAFDRQWLRSKLNSNPTDLSLITVRGDSMSPTLLDGDAIFVDSNVDELRDGIHVFQMDGDLLVKRIQKLPGSSVSVISDNPKFPPFTVDMNAPDCGLTIIGRYRGRISIE